MSVGIGGYRSLPTRVRYTPAQVARYLPLTWGLPAHAGDRGVAVVRCKRGAGRCNHKCEQDQWSEGCMVDGDHKRCEHKHSGHDWCGKCVCIDPGRIRADDPRESDQLATAIDMRQGWLYADKPFRVSWALRLRHKDGLTIEEIAKVQNCAKATAHLRLSLGHSLIADYLNGVRQ